MSLFFESLLNYLIFLLIPLKRNQILNNKEKFDYLSIQPITRSIPPMRQVAKRHYGVHPYFTRRSYNVVQEFIKNFSQPGDLVVDPFGGSGVTAIESLVLRRRAIHIDINPLANFIARCVSVSPVNLDELENTFRDISKKHKKYILYLNNLSNEQIKSEPIKYWYPQNVLLPQKSNRAFVHELFSPRQLRALTILHEEINRIKDDIIRTLFLYIFSAVVAKCNLTFSGSKGRKQSRGVSSPLKVANYWIPPEPVELETWEQFKGKFKRLLEAKSETNIEIGDFYNEDNIKIIKGDATNLKNVIETESVDYIYTDPPYGANIAYLGLSTMWNAWLGLEVTEEDKVAEIIEGGDLNKTKEDYTERLKKSIYEIFRILKYDRWFSLVFAHKDILFWDTIVKAAESCGFEYINISVVKAGIVSFHKHKNPLKVLSSEMVINFVKKRHPRAVSVSKVGIETVDLILDSAELSIVNGENGASTEEIYEDLIPRLIENGLLSEIRDKISDITPLLGDKFDFNHLSGRWVIPPDTKLGSHIHIELRIQFYIESYLNQCHRRSIKATFDDIWSNVIPLLKNGDQPSEQSLIKELNKIAETYEGNYYRLRKEYQRELFDTREFLKERPGESGLPEWKIYNEEDTSHDEIIFRLALLGEAIGLKPLVGLRERSAGDNAKRLNEVSLPGLPKGLGLTKFSRKKVEQIDLIWFDQAGFPAYAFEIEKSTPITTGIDRFIELLKIKIDVSGKTILVCPSSRKAKLDEILTESHYIGEPLYMDRKLKYLYFKDIIDLYTTCYKSKISREFIIVEIGRRLRSPIIK